MGQRVERQEGVQHLAWRERLPARERYHAPGHAGLGFLLRPDGRERARALRERLVERRPRALARRRAMRGRWGAAHEYGEPLVEKRMHARRPKPGRHVYPAPLGRARRRQREVFEREATHPGRDGRLGEVRHRSQEDTRGLLEVRRLRASPLVARRARVERQDECPGGGVCPQESRLANERALQPLALFPGRAAAVRHRERSEQGRGRAGLPRASEGQAEASEGVHQPRSPATRERAQHVPAGERRGPDSEVGGGDGHGKEDARRASLGQREAPEQEHQGNPEQNPDRDQGDRQRPAKIDRLGRGLGAGALAHHVGDARDDDEDPDRVVHRCF